MARGWVRGGGLERVCWRGGVREGGLESLG